MRSISFIAAALLATPFVTGAAQQPFEGVVEYDMTGSGQAIHTIYYQKGSHVRTEMNVGGQAAAMIMDGTTGTMITIMPSQKMYMTMNFRSMAAGMQRQSRDSVHLPKITATGRHETIAGHDCEHVLMTNETDHSQVDMCVARGMGYYMSGGAGGGRGARDFWSNIPNADDPRYAEFRRQFAGGFFPLKMEMKDEHGQVQMTMVATKIDRRSLSDDLFKPPADYTEMKMPGR